MQVVNLHVQPPKPIPQPAGDMLGGGGTCEFSAQTLRRTLAGHTSHRLLRVPPIRLLLLSQLHSSRRRTGCQPVLRGGPRGAALAREPALLGHRSAAGGLVGEARMAKRRKHRASGGQDARSECPALGTGSPEFRERLRINYAPDQFPAPNGSLPAAGSVAGAAAGFAAAGARDPATCSIAVNASFIAAASGD